MVEEFVILQRTSVQYIPFMVFGARCLTLRKPRHAAATD